MDSPENLPDVRKKAYFSYLSFQKKMLSMPVFPAQNRLSVSCRAGRWILAVLVIFLFFGNVTARSPVVGQWKRYETVFTDTTWQGNPFDIILEVAFTAPSGRVFRQYGFYAGDSLWKVYFMPDEKGLWHYRSFCSDPDLDGREGVFRCVKSDLDPPLHGEGRQWVLQGGGGDFPVIWAPVYAGAGPWAFRGLPPASPVVREMLRFAADTVQARLLGFGELVVMKTGWAAAWPPSALPYVTGREGERFYLPFWDSLNVRMDAARDMNMGAYVMLYGDDEMTPDRYGITPGSPAEKRLFRYVVARLACYPHLLWDTGVDIGEYRSDAWINAFADWFRHHDPWHHPVGSRTGGGSGGILPDSATYMSLGWDHLMTRQAMETMREKTKVPVAYTDHWRIFISRGHWTNEKIRIAAWRCALTGAQAFFADYNQGQPVDSLVRRGARYIGIASSFFRHDLRCNLSALRPHDDLLRKANDVILAAYPGKEYVAYAATGNPFGVDLSAVKGKMHVVWLDPRTGWKVKGASVKGGGTRTFQPPGKGGDRVLHLFK